MSSQLDRELAREAWGKGADGGAEAPPVAVDPGSPPPPPATHAPPRRSVGLLAGLLVATAGIASLFLWGFQGASVYAASVDEAMREREKLAGRALRIEGELVPGSLERRDKPCEFRFVVKGATERVAVKFPRCSVPDTFRDMPGGGVQVTVEGKLAADGSFDATNVMAKCTSKYDPATHQMGAASAATPTPAATDTLVQ
jgi:cytochrome c-type biogenesis protein CcmE